MHMLGIYQARVSKYQLYLTLIPTDVTYHIPYIYRKHYFKAKFLKKSLNNINLKKLAHP